MYFFYVDNSNSSVFFRKSLATTQAANKNIVKFRRQDYTCSRPSPRLARAVSTPRLATDSPESRRGVQRP